MISRKLGANLSKRLYGDQTTISWSARCLLELLILSLMAFDLVIFDCDGVLVDSEMISCNCLAETLREHGIETSLDEIFERFLGRSGSAVIDHYRQRGQVLPPQFGRMLRERVLGEFEVSLTGISGIAAVLRDLALPACVASSSDLDRVRFSLDLAGLSRWFGSNVFSAQMVARGKPQPDLFLYAAECMGVSPQRCVVIEDSVSGVLAAKAAGMAAWGFVGGAHHAAGRGRARLRDAGADRIFDRMDDFPCLTTCHRP